MRFLRKNTAVIVSVGPFYDKTDGVTIETALTISNERITLVADTDDGSAPTNILDNVTGATSGTSNDLNYITGNDAGMMQLELTAADVNRNGRLLLSITDAANHVPVFHEFMILPQAIYDLLVAGTVTTLDADVQEWKGSTAPAMTGDAFARLGAPTGASVSADIAAVQADTDNLQTRIPAALTADGNIKADTLRVGGILQTAGDLAALITAVDDLVDTEVAAIKTVVDAIKAKTDSLTYTKALELDVNVQSINGTTVNGDGAGTPWGP